MKYIILLNNSYKSFSDIFQNQTNIDIVYDNLYKRKTLGYTLNQSEMNDNIIIVFDLDITYTIIAVIQCVYV